MSRLLDALGPVRLSRLTRRDTVTRSGRQITAHTDEHLIAQVRAERAERERNEQLTSALPRVTLLDAGTLTWE